MGTDIPFTVLFIGYILFLLNYMSEYKETLLFIMQEDLSKIPTI